MSGLVQRVRANVDDSCVVTGMDKQGCRVSVDGAPSSRLIVDLDEDGSPLGPQDRRCDYLFFADADDGGDGWVATLELKRGRFHSGQFARQLQAGAAAAERIVPGNVAVRFRPVAVYGGGVTKAERLRWQRQPSRVRFRGKHELLRRMTCGQELANQLR